MNCLTVNYRGIRIEISLSHDADIGVLNSLITAHYVIGIRPAYKF